MTKNEAQMTARERAAMIDAMTPAERAARRAIREGLRKAREAEDRERAASGAKVETVFLQDWM